jgi:Flp pilus assembly pilin Flp
VARQRRKNTCDGPGLKARPVLLGMMEDRLRKAERRCFVRDERGVATIEWVMIAAVVLIASLAISVAVMNGASTLGGSVANQMTNAATPAP